MRLHIVCLLASLFVSSNLNGQEGRARPAPGGTKTLKVDADKALIISELGAVITEEDGKIAVNLIPSGGGKRQGTAPPDIASGDVVGMINSKRISSIAELREMYEQASVGDEVKIGLRREGRPHIVTFAKKDPKDQPTMMIVRKSDGNAEDEDVLPALGIIVRKEKKSVVIAGTMPNAPADLKKGDIIRSLNGKPVNSVKDFSAEFDATAVGDELRFQLVRDGKTVTFATPRT